MRLSNPLGIVFKYAIEVLDMEFSVHNPHRLLEYWVNKIKKSSKISKKNKRVIMKFHDECVSLRLSDSRIKNFLQMLWKISQWIKKDFEDMNEEDVKALARIIQKQGYKPNTELGYLELIKKLILKLENILSHRC